MISYVCIEVPDMRQREGVPVAFRYEASDRTEVEFCRLLYDKLCEMRADPVRHGLLDDSVPDWLGDRNRYALDHTAMTDAIWARCMRSGMPLTTPRDAVCAFKLQERRAV